MARRDLSAQTLTFCTLQPHSWLELHIKLARESLLSFRLFFFFFFCHGLKNKNLVNQEIRRRWCSPPGFSLFQHHEYTLLSNPITSLLFLFHLGDINSMAAMEIMPERVLVPSEQPNMATLVQFLKTKCHTRIDSPATGLWVMKSV